MRTLPIVGIILSLALSLPASAAVDPLEAFGKARTHIANKQYREAVALLEPALESAASIEDPAARTQALGAIHFYAAVAYSGLGSDDKARQHLQAYFAANPQARRIDPNKYDRHFVQLFDSVAGNASGASSRDRFETYYPSFSSFTSPVTKQPEPGTWGTLPVMELLASNEEAHAWREMTDPAERLRFVTEFWQRRDPKPDTPVNEFKEAFERRVAFADKTFGEESTRGALTDRGQVFVLLGEPPFVRRRPITEADAIKLAYPSTMVNGSIEQWTYFREQLPMALGKPQVSYRFVTQLGIGENVLQRQEDAYAMQALALAGKPQATH